ncbi:MAG: cadherin domain-containing protein, partial [Gammaproteobacteria bacterium]|nr:cadherin domain-containing protein [Gammaproteobacteria bacterium]
MAQITGDSLNNTLSGDVDGSVDDTLYGMAGNDTLLGLTGNDLLDGGSGADTLIGGIGDDSYVVDSLGDLVVEQANEGDDTVSANFSYTLTDNVENLVLLGTAVRGTGNDSDNTITGTSGSNIIDGGAGADLMQGGAGNDTYYVDSAFDQVVELAGEGADLVYSTVSYTLTDALENLTLLGAADLVARGTAAANTLIGNAGANLLDGGDGNDILDGGAGIDTLVGGNGNDTYIVDNANEIVRATLDAGIDTVRASVDYTLGAYQENLILTGPAVSGTGNGTDNVITGNALANTLTGGDGNDTLDGGAGVDLLVGGNGNDLYIIDNAAEIALGTLDAGIDTVKSSVDYTLGINQENLALAGSALLGIGNAGNNVIAGNGLANTLQGGDGNDTLNGGLGADILIGGAGNDVYMVDNVLDSVIEVAGEGLDVVSASVSFALREEVENLTLTGSANIDGTGNLGNNVITGNAGNNVLYGGGGGLDTLNGGAGNDTYLIDSTSVSIVEASTGGVDLVRANIDFTLGAHLENLELVGAANQGIGNAAANIITGSAVANFLDGKAGADTLIGAEGDDILVHDASDILLSGGAGNDTLLLAAPTALLDLTTASNLQGIERVDVADSGATVRLSAAAVTALSDSDLLVIDGAAGAAVTTSDAWNYVGDFGDYARYQLNGATLDIALAVTRSGVVLAAPPPPPANSLAFDSASSASVLENATGAVIDVNATNVNQPAQILSYAISGGADAGKFAIDAGSGVVSFISAPDYEAPTDSDGDNVYLLQVTASDGVLSATQDIAVSVAAVNDNTPVMTSANTANFAENATGAIMTVQAVDADLPSQSLAYSISGGVDALRFAINATTGALTFVNAPNFEAPTDASANNIYDVQVTASDGERAVSQSIAVSVTPVNDNAPVITSAATVNFAENATGTVIDVNATDADLPAPLLTYSISAGADAAKFAINATTGVVTFVTAPNYEAPTDVGADNVYNLQVTASDGARSTAQNIAVTVTPVNEYSPVFTSLASVSFAENGTGTVLDVNANDADLPAPTLTFSITGGADAAKFAINASTGILTFVSAPNYENPTDLGADNVYNLQVTASDGARSATQAIAVTVTAVNEFAPVFSSAATASFAENGLGTVLDVNATDADLPAPTLSYSITGGVDAARFAINASTGVVTFVSAPDYENPADLGADNVYNLQVTASDGARSTTQSIAVTVTAVNEFAPVFSSAATAIFAENGTGTILTVQATDADLPAPALSYSISGGVDAAQFAIDAATGALRFVAPPSFAAPTDSGANNVYDVQVAASDGVRSTSQALAITVTTANSNAPVITSSSTVSFVENGVGPVVDVNATDADLPAQTLTYSITG